jgi:cell division protein FtsQ
MKKKHTYSLRKIFTAAGWLAIGTGVLLLLLASISRRNSERCSGMSVSISGYGNDYFITKDDVENILRRENGKVFKNELVHQINLASLETSVEKIEWVKNAELYFDNNNILRVKITERVPIARIFTTSGESYYLDTSWNRLPLSNEFSARVPVFTNFPGDSKTLTGSDSLLLKDICILSQFIGNHPFWMAQIDQINITHDSTFDLYPELGDQVIHFGSAKDVEQKFHNLFCFYKQVLAKYGWSRYSEINVQFKGQVVATKRGVQEIRTDSLRSVEIMQSLIANARKESDDENNIQLDQSLDNANRVNISKETGDIPDETVPENNNNENKMPISVTPTIHVPEKPKSGTENFKKSTLMKHSSSFEKPDPFPHKTNTVKKERKSDHRVPKSVMPPKTDY